MVVVGGIVVAAVAVGYRMVSAAVEGVAVLGNAYINEDDSELEEDDEGDEEDEG